MKTLEDIKKDGWESGINQVWLGDCLEAMKLIPDKSVDLVLTDPPYGKMWTRGINGIGVLKDKNEDDKTLWDIKPTKEVFDEIIRVSKNQIIFGGNYFTNYLSPSNCWIVWDKLGDLKLGKQIPFAHCELAWTSLNKTVKKYTFRSQGFIKDTKDERVHPTQKPTELFSEIIKDFSNEGDIIYDPFLGSGTTAVAAKQLKRNFIGIETSPTYCKIAEERLKQEILL